jgi:hypothetical protein
MYGQRAFLFSALATGIETWFISCTFISSHVDFRERGGKVFGTAKAYLLGLYADQTVSVNVVEHPQAWEGTSSRVTRQK